MQSRFVLALCAFALLFAIVAAQQQHKPSFFEKLEQKAEQLVHDTVVDVNAAVHCIKEAGDHCRDKLAIPLTDYIKCAIGYIEDNKEKCKKESE